MAMVKPISLPVNAFDATQAHLFEFISSGGNQVVKNMLVIRNNTTNVVIYQSVVESYKYEQELPMNILTNGIYYNYSFTTYDINGNSSPESNRVPFYCYTTPKLEFINIPLSNVIESSNFNFQLSYSQLEGELIDTVEFYLYDLTGNILASSGGLYNTNIPPIIFNYIFSGFDDNKNYRISAKGVTVNGTLIHSDIIEFSVNYFQPSLYSILKLENVCNEGYIKIGNNMIIIDGVSNPSPPIYIADKEVDIRGDGTYVKWVEGYSIINNFTVEIAVRDIKSFNRLLLLSNNLDSINNPYKIEVGIFKNMLDDKNYLELKAYSDNKYIYNYIYTDNGYLDSELLNKKMFLWIRRINNIFELKWEVIP